MQESSTVATAAGLKRGVRPALADINQQPQSPHLQQIITTTTAAEKAKASTEVGKSENHKQVVNPAVVLPTRSSRRLTKQNQKGQMLIEKALTKGSTTD